MLGFLLLVLQVVSFFDGIASFSVYTIPETSSFFVPQAHLGWVQDFELRVSLMNR